MNRFGFRSIGKLLGGSLVLLLVGNWPTFVRAADPRETRTPQALGALIDRHIQAKLAEQKQTALGQADDASFLRRLWFDLHGTLPPADRAAAFLDGQDPNKRSKLIEELLAGEQYGQNQSDIWYGLLIPLFPTNKNKVETERLAPWLTTQFNENRPWDKLVYEMLTATGATIIENPAMIPFLNGPTVLKQEEITDLVSSVFLGANLKCAQCHRHPFTNWTQKDYWGMAAFFSRMVRAGTGNSNIRGMTEGTPRKVMLPERALTVPPKFLGGEEPKMGPDEPYRPVFAAWATSPQNPFFARTMVNRTWAQFFGRGLVNPLDDVLPDNEQTTHPELLRELTEAFVASGFDLKLLARGICESQTYQRTSKPVAGTKDTELLYGRMAVRVLTPQQLSNALTALSVFKIANRRVSREFLQAFSVAGEDFDPLHYERGIPPQLRLANAPALEQGRKDLARTLVASTKTPTEFVEQAYLHILSRRPTTEETQQMIAFINLTGVPQAHDDLVWVLLNSSEFTLIR